MTSQVVQGAWLKKGGYGRFRGQCVKRNEKHAGVPVLLYEKTTTYCFSDLSLNGNLYVLNVYALVRALVHALMTQQIMRSR